MQIVGYINTNNDISIELRGEETAGETGVLFILLFEKILQLKFMTSVTHDGAATLATCTGNTTYHFCTASFPQCSCGFSYKARPSISDESEHVSLYNSSRQKFRPSALGPHGPTFNLLKPKPYFMNHQV